MERLAAEDSVCETLLILGRPVHNHPTDTGQFLPKEWCKEYQSLILYLHTAINSANSGIAAVLCQEFGTRDAAGKACALCRRNFAECVAEKPQHLAEIRSANQTYLESKPKSRCDRIRLHLHQFAEIHLQGLQRRNDWGEYHAVHAPDPRSNWCS